MNSKLKVGFFRIHKKVIDPEFATENSACFDLRFQPQDNTFLSYYTPWNEKREIQFTTETTEFVIDPGERLLAPTGLILDIPEGYEVKIFPRSGHSYKKGLALANCVGVIDSDYVEPLFVLLHNTSCAPVVIERNERIAQAQLLELVKYKVLNIAKRPEKKTTRDGGFGSTGEK
jgi:dUTP pyrophosphatase